jgi:hypothetical protein
MTSRLQDDFPGVDFNFCQYIEDNVEEAASGVKGENSVKLFGGDPETLEKTANRIKDVMATVPGIADAGGVFFVLAADGAHRRGQSEGGAVRAGTGRHQYDHPGRHRRANGERPV